MEKKARTLINSRHLKLTKSPSKLVHPYWPPHRLLGGDFSSFARRKQGSRPRTLSQKVLMMPEVLQRFRWASYMTHPMISIVFLLLRKPKQRSKRAGGGGKERFSRRVAE